jgi:hypothetical protein
VEELILNEPSINIDYIMAYGAMTSDDYKWRNPTWEVAIKREDSAKWLEASKLEEDKLLAQKMYSIPRRICERWRV